VNRERKPWYLGSSLLWKVGKNCRKVTEILCMFLPGRKRSYVFLHLVLQSSFVSHVKKPYDGIRQPIGMLKFPNS
jgi:hypothetical protein